MSGPSHITDEMRAAVGSIVDWRVSFPVAASDIRKWAIAVYYPQSAPARYLNPAAAGPGGIIAPEEFNPFAWAVADKMVPAITPALRDSDRMEKAIGITGPGLPNQINGGSEARYGVPIRPGDVIRSETRLHEYRERQGRLGLMLITITEVNWTNQHGELVKIGRDTAIRYDARPGAIR